MRTAGRLAVILNGIVVSSLGACGGSVEGDPMSGSPSGDNGRAGTPGESGSGGREHTGGSSSGGNSVVVTSGGAGGTSDIATAGMGSVGSGGSVGTAGSGAGGAVSVVSKPLCDAQGLLQYVEGLHLPQPVDYLGVYLIESIGNASVYQSTGSPCGGADDPTVCQSDLATGAPMAGFPYLYLSPSASPTLPSYLYLYLAYTRGNRVGFITDHSQLTAFLGEIDTPNEAGLVFRTMGVAPTCNSISETATAYYYSTPLFPSGCSISPPGRQYSVTHAGDAAWIPVGMATPCVGRRPAGLRSERVESASPLGEYYASVAQLEGAAVLAFDAMADELKRFGAPAELRLRAQRARADEERHHLDMARFARREGAAVRDAQAAAPSERSLLAAALDNAVEGCVREAWGAMSAHHQAATAAEPAARLLWQNIAIDESEHAELSLDLHEWFMGQLTSEECQLVERAMQRARLELRHELAFGPAPHPWVELQAGVPGPARATALFGELERCVLSTISSVGAPLL